MFVGICWGDAEQSSTPRHPGACRDPRRHGSGTSQVVGTGDRRHDVGGDGLKTPQPRLRSASRSFELGPGENRCRRPGPAGRPNRRRTIQRHCRTCRRDPICSAPCLSRRGSGRRCFGHTRRCRPKIAPASRKTGRRSRCGRRIPIALRGQEPRRAGQPERFCDRHVVVETSRQYRSLWKKPGVRIGIGKEHWDSASSIFEAQRSPGSIIATSWNSWTGMRPSCVRSSPASVAVVLAGVAEEPCRWQIGHKRGVFQFAESSYRAEAELQPPENNRPALTFH